MTLAAGTLLSAGPASGAGHDSAGATPSAARVLKPRLDLNNDRLGDRLYRTPLNAGIAIKELDGSDSGHAYGLGDTTEVARDVVALGNIRGGWGTELLRWLPDGRVSLQQAYENGVQAPTWTGSGWQIYNKLIATNDITGDGRPDLVARTYSGDLYLYRATGADTGNPFAARVKIGYGWGIYDQIVGTGDLDTDGHGDLVAKSPDGKLYYYKGTGTASAPFKDRTLVGGGWNIYSKLVAADYYAGSKNGIYAIGTDGVMYFYPSKGNGVFDTRLITGSPTSSFKWTQADAVVNSGVTPVYGKHGVTAVDAAGSVWAYTNLTTGRFDGKQQKLAQTVPAGAKLFSAAGVDQKNRVTRYVLKGSALTTLITGSTVKGDFTNTRLVFGPGDLTGDGRGDLLTVDTSGVLWLRSNTGSAASTTSFANPVRVGSGWKTSLIVGAGDINGDGRADIVWRGLDGHLYMYRGTGDAAQPFASGREEVGTTGWDAYTNLTAPGDLNGDGRADILGTDAKGEVWLHTSTGLGGTKSFSARSYVDKGWNQYAQTN